MTENSCTEFVICLQVCNPSRTRSPRGLPEADAIQSFGRSRVRSRLGLAALISDVIRF